MVEEESAVIMGGKRTLDEISSNEEDNDNATMRDGDGSPTSRDETANNGNNNVNNDSDAMVRRFIHNHYYKSIYCLIIIYGIPKIMILNTRTVVYEIFFK
jgi:hypothetical protein